MMMNLRITHVPLLGVLVGIGGCLQPDSLVGDTSSETSGSSTGPAAAATSTGSTSTSDPTTGDPTDTSSTTAPIGSCGDGVVDIDEECDDADDNADDAACTSACLRNVCGDGKLWPGHEDCDDGAANADSATCTGACTLARCGDGKLQDGVEVCDDGVNDGGYGGCAMDCKAKGPFCGDKVKNGAEAAVADINKAGGILGQQVVLKLADDAGDPKQGVSAANLLVGDGVKFVVGPVTSGVAIPASYAARTSVTAQDGVATVSCPQ